MSRVLEAVQEELAELRARVAQLERFEAELTGAEPVATGGGRVRKPLALPKPKAAAKREGEQRRPPAGGSRATRRARLLEQLQAMRAKDPGVSAEAARTKLGCSWKLAKELLDELAR